MSQTEPQPAPPEPERSGFQFSLQTLLLLFVVLGSSLAVFGAWGIVVFALMVGLALCLHHRWPLAYLALVVLCLMCLLCLLPAVQSAREPALRAQCAANLKQIALELLNYEAANGCFPPAYIRDKDGRPMHSWRVLILQYMLQPTLYKAYDFAEPWDGARNKELLAYCPVGYQCPADPNFAAPAVTQTSFVAVVGRNAAWPGTKARKLGPTDFPGGASHTIMLVEVANSGISWMEPRDLSLDVIGASGATLPTWAVSSNHHLSDEFFFSYDRCGAHVATADGNVHYLPPGSLSSKHLRKILQVGGFSEEEMRSGDSPYAAGRRLNWPNIAALAVWLLSVGMLLARAVRSRKVRSSSAAANSSGGKEIFQSEDS